MWCAMTSSIELIVTPQADRDIRDILQFTFQTWGSGQEDRYRLVLLSALERIRMFPDIGHPAEGRPSTIRIYHLRHHFIQYRREPDKVVILRILNPRRRR
jgi:plasmid stabilization system protein ParE